MGLLLFLYLVQWSGPSTTKISLYMFALTIPCRHDNSRINEYFALKLYRNILRIKKCYLYLAIFEKKIEILWVFSKIANFHFFCMWFWPFWTQFFVIELTFLHFFARGRGRGEMGLRQLFVKKIMFILFVCVSDHFEHFLNKICCHRRFLLRKFSECGCGSGGISWDLFTNKNLFLCVLDHLEYFLKNRICICESRSRNRSCPSVCPSDRDAEISGR